MRLTPLQQDDVLSSLSPWNPEHNPEMSQEEQTRWFLESTADRPGSRRFQVNAISDLLADEAASDDDKREFIIDATHRWFETPHEAVEWLSALVDDLQSVTRTVRTTTTDGVAPSLLATSRLRSALAGLKSRVEGLVEPTDAATVLIDWLGADADRDAGDLLALMNSDHSDRNKADFIAETIGPHFYSDLEAIEWAAAVARDVLDRLSEHYG